MKKRETIKPVAAPKGCIRFPDRFNVRSSSNPPRSVSWSCHPSPLGPILIGMSDGALWRLDFAQPTLKAKLANWKQRFRKTEFVEDQKSGADVMARMLGKKSGKWTQDVWLQGTAFQQKVWKQLIAMKQGEITSYGAIARKIGNPKASRPVGGAVGSNPITILLPCHRVMASDGSLNGYASGLPMKRRVLAAEGLDYSKAA